MASVTEPTTKRGDTQSRDCLTVYHDGSCPLCVREIALMRRLTDGEDVEFVDVSGVQADELVSGDLTASDAMKRFHIRRTDGSLVSGAAAFIAVWSASPRLRWLAPLGRSRLAVGVLDRIYNLFLIVRPAMQRAVWRFDDRR